MTALAEWSSIKSRDEDNKWTASYDGVPLCVRAWGKPSCHQFLDDRSREKKGLLDGLFPSAGVEVHKVVGWA